MLIIILVLFKLFIYIIQGIRNSNQNKQMKQQSSLRTLDYPKPLSNPPAHKSPSSPRLPSHLLSNQITSQLVQQNSNPGLPSLSLKMRMEYMLGTGHSPTKTANIYAYDNNQVVYYTKRMLVRYNVVSKGYRIVYEGYHGDCIGDAIQDDDSTGGRSAGKMSKSKKDREHEGKVDQVKQYQQQDQAHMQYLNWSHSNPNNNNNSVHDGLVLTKLFIASPTTSKLSSSANPNHNNKLNNLFIALNKYKHSYYLSLFWVETNRPATVIKISEESKEIYTNLAFHEKKGYIYLMYKNGEQKQMYLKVIQVVTPSSLLLNNNNNNNGHAVQMKRPQTSIPSSTGNHNNNTNNSNNNNNNLSSGAGLTSFPGSSKNFVCSRPIIPQKQKQPTPISAKYKTLINSPIKKTGGGCYELQDLLVGQNQSELYLWGLDYFRMWRIMFNEKSIKQSNYRNIQRNIKKHQIMSIFWVSQALLSNPNQQGNAVVGNANGVGLVGSTQKSPYLVIITAAECLFIRNNQLLKITSIMPQSSTMQHRQTAEIVLQRSLNQIYKTKFRVETFGSEGDQNNQTKNQQLENEGNNNHKNDVMSKVIAASLPWVESIDSVATKSRDISNNGVHTNINININQKGKDKKNQKHIVKFCTAFDFNRIYIYKINADLTVKIQHCINPLHQQSYGNNSLQDHRLFSSSSSPSSAFSTPLNNTNNPNQKPSLSSLTLSHISPSSCGNLLLLTDSNKNNYINNRNHDSQNYDINPLYMGGHAHNDVPILSVSTPELMNLCSSVSCDGQMRLWAVSEKERVVLGDFSGFKVKPLQIQMHSSGLVIIVNFGLQIKVYGIVSNELQQIVSIKTSDFCKSIQYCKNNSFLLSNQKNILKLYDPFTLHTLAKMQPDDMRIEYKKAKISDNCEYLMYQCCNYKVYRISVSSIFNSQQKLSSANDNHHINSNSNSSHVGSMHNNSRPTNNSPSSSSNNSNNSNSSNGDSNYFNINSYNYLQQLKSDNPMYCHRQTEEYTCWYFNYGVAKSNIMLAVEMLNKREANNNNNNGSNSVGNNRNSNSNNDVILSAHNIFVGFTKTKFMVLYGNFGERLIAEFKHDKGHYVTNCVVTETMIFLATNAGSIIAYRWPILECHLELEMSNQMTAENQRICHYRLPTPLIQFQAWQDNTPITCLYKTPNKPELILGSTDGTLAFLSYSLYKNGYQYYQPELMATLSSEHKRMVNASNNLKLVKIAEIDKISKLIEKTENDIEKIQYEIGNEKQKRNMQMKGELEEAKGNIQKRRKVYVSGAHQKIQQLQKQLKSYQNELSSKKKQLSKIIAKLNQSNGNKLSYQKQRIKDIKQQIQNEKVKYKDQVLLLIDEHKNNIRRIKEKNLKFIQKLQAEFQMQVRGKFQKGKQKENGGNSVGNIGFEYEVNDVQIEAQKIKVLELEQVITHKNMELAKISEKSQQARIQDEQIQKLFEKKLQRYNQQRYQNLILHSQLLKIQNQLHERQQILSKKDEIIKLAFQQKQINETYKQFVSGSICGLQDQKQKAYQDYVKKQQDLKMLFEQLTGEINKSGSKKLKLGQLKQALKIFQKQKGEKQLYIKEAVQKLKNLKKYLLVQGASEDSEHKKFYQQQQKLLSTIRWLQKRFRMNCINQKKLTYLKKSGVNQVIGQNKNLLEQCNQLREEGIIYENQIEHLSRKLGEANKIIQVERKLKDQKNAISKQNQKLNEIRKLFTDQIQRVKQHDGSNEED